MIQLSPDHACSDTSNDVKITIIEVLTGVLNLQPEKRTVIDNLLCPHLPIFLTFLHIMHNLVIYGC